VAPADLDEPKKRDGSSMAMWSLVLLFLSLIGGGVYYFWGQYKAERQHQVTQHLRIAAEQFKRDNYAAYQKAVHEAREAIRLDGNSAAAHAYLAYAQAVRLEEHAGGEAALEEAKKHLAIAKQSGEALSYTYMAEALLESYQGRTVHAERTLSDLAQKHESEGKRPALLLMTLGTLQMALGELDLASESLEKSLRFAPDEPRIYALSGKLARQKGNTPEARRLYEAVLSRHERNHPDSLIGRSWAILEQEEPGRSYMDAAQDLSSLLGGKLELSVRQEAMAHMLQALLIARVSADLPLFRPESFQKELEEKTGIGTQKTQNASRIAASETAALSDSQNPELRLIRAQRLVAENNIDGAIAEANKAVLEAPSRIYFQIELARLWMRKNPASKEAEEVLRRAQAVVPRNPVIPVLLAQVLVKQQKVDDAILVLQTATASATVKNPDAKMLLATVFRDNKKDYPKAVALYTEAASEFGRDKVRVARAYLELGITHERAGEAKQSKEAYGQALTVDYSFEKAYCRLGDVLEASVDPEDKERLAKLAEAYLSGWAHGECAAKMQQRAPKPTP
jgi:Flp pilus assembly protein TadD/flagellar basal body-associated protein FliL